MRATVVPALLFLLAAAVGACRAVSDAGGRPSGNDRDPERSAPVATVGGRGLSKEELSDWWFERYPEEYQRTLEALIDERLAIEEARTQGVRVPREALEKAVAAEVEARRTQLRTVYGEGVDLEAEVRRAYGLDLAAWRARVLTPRLHAHLLMQRVIRWDTRRRERVHARVIVLGDAARAADLAARLRRGADFSLLAARESQDPSGKRGGDLPWIARGDLAFPGVEERLFAAPAGGLVGPLEVPVDGRAQFHVYKVIERLAPWEGPLETHWRRLEDDLLARPVQQAEYERWKVRSRHDAGVRLYRPDGRVWTPGRPR